MAAAPTKYRRPFLVLLAALFAALTILYSAIWLYYAHTAGPQLVIVWGTVAGLALSFAVLLSSIRYSYTEGQPDPHSLHVGVSELTFLPLLLIPLAFGYAVVKHQVLDVPILLRQGR